jgi:alcohol dehydrogenase
MINLHRGGEIERPLAPILTAMSARWWLRQARALADPAGPVAGRIMFEREAEQRVRRLRAALADATRQRVRPSRARMRALTLTPGGRLRWRMVPTPPPPGSLGAVVRPLVVATCDLDRPLGLGATPFLAPLHFGHECVAEVLAVGSDVIACRPGQRVVVPFQISCGVCTACRAGRTSNCQTVPPISMYGFGVAGGHWGGAVADELAVPYADGMLVPLPQGIEPTAAASVADNVPDGYRHVAPHLPGLLAAGHPPRMIVLGAQSKRHLFTASVALYAGLVARALGAAEVTVIDARADVRAQAEALGLVAVAPKQARGLAPAPLVADISATPAGLRRALELTAPDGICSSAGSLHAVSRIPSASMFGRNATLIVARSHARALIPGVLALIAEGKLAPERVTTVLAPIDDAAAALNEHLRGGSTKTIVAV